MTIDETEVQLGLEYEKACESHDAPDDMDSDDFRSTESGPQPETSRDESEGDDV